MTKNVGERIKELRQLKRFSREALAKILGTTSHNIYQLETGRRNVSLKWLARIAKALGCEPSTLISENNPTDISEYQPNQTVLPPLRPSLSLVSDNPYPITQKHLKYSMDIYDQVIGSNRHFEEEKIAILYEIYKIVYDFFENQHHQESDISTIEVQAKAMQGVSDLLRRKKKSE